MAYCQGYWLLIALLIAWCPACGGDRVPPAASGGGGTSATDVGGAGGVLAMGGAGGLSSAVTAGSDGAGGVAGQGGGMAGSGPTWGDTLVDLQELDLGDVGLHVFSEFPMPDNTLGFTVLAEATMLGGWLGIYRLKAAAGSSVIQNYGMADKDQQVFAGFNWSAAANPQADNVHAWPVKVGDWAVVVGGAGMPTARARVWARRTVDGQFHGGEVDFNVFIAPNTVTVIYAKTVIEKLFAAHFGPKVGLTLGSVFYTALPSDYGILETRAEYRALLASSASIGSAPAINLFVVADFDDTEFASAIGVAGGVPGSPMVHGTDLSGVAYQPSGDVDDDALVLAHEIGHLAGLFHTTEASGTVDDPLSDTVICDYEVITTDPASCPDIDNIMFPMAAGGEALSAAQAMVMRGSAIYRGIIEAGGQPAPPLFEEAARNLGRWPRLKQGMVARGKTLAWTKRRSPTDAVERWLGAHWCDRGSGYERVVMRVAARAKPGRLVALVKDRGASDLIRARALATLMRASSMPPHALARLSERVLSDTATGRNLGVTAIGVLATHGRRALRALGPLVRDRDDPVVNHYLRQALGK